MEEDNLLDTCVRLALVAAAAVAIAFATPVLAQDAPTGLDAGLEQQVRLLAETGSRALPAGASRVEVSIGQLDPRLRLAPCQRIEPYLPANARLWGKSRIGLRCMQGTTLWNVFLPITVKVFGRALVAPQGAAAGTVLAPTDLAEAEVDFAAEVAPAVSDAGQAVGRVLAQALQPGQTLRQTHLKVRQWFAAGDTVKVVVAGAGFTLEGAGQALTHGLEGGSVRVRTESGHVLSGRPIGERRVELVL